MAIKREKEKGREAKQRKIKSCPLRNVIEGNGGLQRKREEGKGLCKKARRGRQGKGEGREREGGTRNRESQSLPYESPNVDGFPPT